jgi:hypothetical protein
VPPDPDGFTYAKGPERARTVKGRPSAGLWRTETVKTKRRIKMKDNNTKCDLATALDNVEMIMDTHETGVPSTIKIIKISTNENGKIIVEFGFKNQEINNG